MSNERFYVCLEIQGTTQYYQREAELPDGKGNFVVKPYFTDRAQAVKLGENAALFLADRLRKLGQQPWLEKTDGTRVDLPWKTETPVSFGDDRQPCMATLDDGDESNPNARWFRVVPVNRPDGGPMWCLKCTPPGFAEPQLMFAMDPLGCLQRAQSLPGIDGKTLLDFGERVEAPQPKPAAPLPNSAPTYRVRTGDRT